MMDIRHTYRNDNSRSLRVFAFVYRKAGCPNPRGSTEYKWVRRNNCKRMSLYVRDIALHSQQLAVLAELAETSQKKIAYTQVTKLQYY
jgi:sarcosine oxidase delta subunit